MFKYGYCIMVNALGWMLVVLCVITVTICARNIQCTNVSTISLYSLTSCSLGASATLLDRCAPQHCTDMDESGWVLVLFIQIFFSTFLFRLYEMSTMSCLSPKCPSGPPPPTHPNIVLSKLYHYIYIVSLYLVEAGSSGSMWPHTSRMATHYQQQCSGWAVSPESHLPVPWHPCKDAMLTTSVLSCGTQCSPVDTNLWCFIFEFINIMPLFPSPLWSVWPMPWRHASVTISPSLP